MTQQKEITGPPSDLRGNKLQLGALYDELVEPMRDHNIARFLDFFLRNNLTVWDKFVTAPGARGENPGHHAFEGGLAYHTLTAAKVAGKIVDHYISLGMHIKRDIVVAGVILHDIGKMHCYEWKDGPRKEYYHGTDTEVSSGYTHTSISKLHHHIPIGYAEFMMQAAAFNNSGGKHSLTEKKINHLGHIILSHHGRRSWSSPVIPNTIEAYIVHVVEMMDAYVDKYNKGCDVRNLYDH